jgi:AcrR family transcriptional regulator
LPVTDRTETTTTGARRPRRRAPRGQGEKLREEILAAAELLLLKTGDQEAVSIRAVAEAVGVTPPSIYLHFSDKTELIFEVCEKHFQKLDRVMEEAAARSNDPLESLKLRGRAYVQFGLDHPEEYRILFMTKPAATPEEWTNSRVMESASFFHLVQAVQACLDARAIRPGDPMLISFGLWAAVHGLTSLLITKPGFPWPDLDSLIGHILTVQVEGLAERTP